MVTDETIRLRLPECAENPINIVLQSSLVTEQTQSARGRVAPDSLACLYECELNCSCCVLLVCSEMLKKIVMT